MTFLIYFIGFSFDVAVANAKPTSVQIDNSSPTPSFSPDSVSNAATSENLFGAGAFDAESVYSADESKSPRGSPGRQTYESPSQENSENHFGKTSDGDAETHRYWGFSFTVTLLQFGIFCTLFIIEHWNCVVEFLTARF